MLQGLPGGATSVSGSALARRPTQPHWPSRTNRAERSPTSLKRPEGPRTTSPTRKMVTRTTTETDDDGDLDNKVGNAELIAVAADCD